MSNETICFIINSRNNTIAFMPNLSQEYVAPVNQLVNDLFCFKTGSEWTYYDSVGQTTQKMVVTNYGHC